MGSICQSKVWNRSVSCDRKERSMGKMFDIVSLLWGFRLYKLSLWWKYLTESALVLCRPGFPVVEHAGSCRFWIQEWVLELCWNSCVNNNNSSCGSSWKSNNSYACSCDSSRNHRKARNTFWLHTAGRGAAPTLCGRKSVIRADGYLKSNSATKLKDALLLRFPSV